MGLLSVPGAAYKEALACILPDFPNILFTLWPWRQVRYNITQYYDVGDSHHVDLMGNGERVVVWNRGQLSHQPPSTFPFLLLPSLSQVVIVMVLLSAALIPTTPETQAGVTRLTPAALILV